MSHTALAANMTNPHSTQEASLSPSQSLLTSRLMLCVVNMNQDYE